MVTLSVRSAGGWVCLAACCCWMDPLALLSGPSDWGEYFSKLLMGFRLTTKADAACIVTLTQPEMKLHPSTTKLFQSIHGERTKIGDRKWSMTKVGATKKSLFVLLLNKPNVQSISRGTNHMICIMQSINSLVFPIPIISFKITWLLVSETCWDVL